MSNNNSVDDDNITLCNKLKEMTMRLELLSKYEAEADNIIMAIEGMLRDGEDDGIIFHEYSDWLYTRSSPHALYLLGLIYWLGYGGGYDNGKAVQLFQKSADSGNPYAQCCLGTIYYYGNDVVKTDYNKAIALFHKASVWNIIPMASYCLGKCYHRGHGTKKDIGLAIQWYSRAIVHSNNNTSDNTNDNARFSFTELLSEYPNECITFISQMVNYNIYTKEMESLIVVNNK